MLAVPVFFLLRINLVYIIWGEELSLRTSHDDQYHISLSGIRTCNHPHIPDILVHAGLLHELTCLNLHLVLEGLTGAVADQVLLQAGR